MALHLWGLTEAAEADTARAAQSETMGYMLGLLAWLIAGSVFIAVKLVQSEMPPWTMCFFRVLITALILTPFVARDHGAMAALLRTRWREVLFIGAIGLGLTQGVMFTALHLTAAINASMVFGLAPVLTLVLARLVLGEPLNAWQALGSMIAFLGIVAVSVEGSFQRLMAFQFGVGELVAFGAALLFAGYTVLLKRAKFELPIMPMLTILLYGGALATVPFFLWEYAEGKHSELGANGYLALFYTALIGGAAMYLCYNWSIEILGAARAGTLVYTQMIFVTIFAWAMLGERLEWYHYVGAACIAFGVLLVIRMRPSRAASVPK